MRNKVTLVLVKNKIQYPCYIIATFTGVTPLVISSVSASSVITSDL